MTDTVAGTDVHHISDDDRRQIEASLFGQPGDALRFWLRYAILLTLSALIATAGLSAGSGAVVIGAMLIAPLMTPIVGSAAAVAVGNGRQLATATIALVASTVWVIAVSWATNSVLPTDGLSLETIARTSPDVRDLIVAVAAGIAGSWAVTRVDVSNALPGVAVAVALVPPLATVGVTLDNGLRDEAEGAFLLYVTNLTAIVAASIIVMAVVGYIPRDRLRSHWRSLTAITALAAAAVIVVAGPLISRANELSDRVNTDADIAAIVDDWLQQTPALEAAGINRAGELITVDVAGPVEPPPADQLTEAINARLDRRYDIRVRWSQRLDGPAAPPADDIGEQIQELTAAWLVEHVSPAATVENITIRDTDIIVRVAGPERPPDGRRLESSINDEVGGGPYSVTVAWTELSIIEPDTTTEQIRAAIAPGVREWATNLGLETVAIVVTPEQIVINVKGADAPADAVALVDTIAAATELAELVVDQTVSVNFEQVVTIPTVATTTTTTTSAPEPPEPEPEAPVL